MIGHRRFECSRYQRKIYHKERLRTSKTGGPAYGAGDVHHEGDPRGNGDDGFGLKKLIFDCLKDW